MTDNSVFIGLNSRCLWTGHSWTSVRTFAIQYTPVDAAEIVARRWGAGEGVPTKNKHGHVLSYQFPKLIPVVPIGEERAEVEASDIKLGERHDR